MYFFQISKFRIWLGCIFQVVDIYEKCQIRTMSDDFIHSFIITYCNLRLKDQRILTSGSGIWFREELLNSTNKLSQENEIRNAGNKDIKFNHISVYMVKIRVLSVNVQVFQVFQFQVLFRLEFWNFFLFCIKKMRGRGGVIL